MAKKKKHEVPKEQTSFGFKIEQSALTRESSNPYSTRTSPGLTLEDSKRMRVGGSEKETPIEQTDATCPKAQASMRPDFHRVFRSGDLEYCVARGCDYSRTVRGVE